MFKELTKSEKAWVLYDVGNSAFTMLACSLIPIWFKALAIGDAPGQITGDEATAYYSLSIAVVTVIVALTGCIANGFAAGWVAFLVIYVLAKICYSSSLTFYDSMLNDVTTEERMDKVSSYGYAWGYIGSCIPFILALGAYVISGGLSEDIMYISPKLGKIIGFTVTAVWWFVVTIPLIRNYHQVNYTEKSKGSVKGVFGKIFGTLRNIALKDRKVLFFLIAFFLYIDGVGTIIDNCINIGTDLGLPTVGQVVFLLATQVVAWIGSLVFARLSHKYSTAQLILVCIVGYFAVCLYALSLKTLLHFGILAFGVGCFQGSIQSLSRSYYSKIIPAENSGEYFGIYDIFAKGASFLGSAVIAVVKFAGGTINIAVASLAIFFALGFIFLRIADKMPSSRKA